MFKFEQFLVADCYMIFRDESKNGFSSTGPSRALSHLWRKAAREMRTYDRTPSNRTASGSTLSCRGYTEAFPRETTQMTLTSAEAKTLAGELADLSHQQSEATETAVYLKMSKAEAAAYDTRSERIARLLELLGKV